jgi:hypothetical protein
MSAPPRNIPRERSHRVMLVVVRTLVVSLLVGGAGYAAGVLAGRALL